MKILKRSLTNVSGCFIDFFLDLDILIPKFYTQNYLVLSFPSFSRTEGRRSRGAGGGFFSILFKTTFVSAYF